jgi:2-phospho-L-lactate/phosphoenolpyruvate guanylyltransferase
MSVPYVVLLPVKPPGRGKSRLGALPRDVLATAFALDAATACLATPSVRQVLVVTDDARFAAKLSALGCASIPDGVSYDLNGSLTLAAVEASRRWPDLLPVAICADLPCLTPDDLEVALAQKPGRPRFVADTTGDGTTLYTAPLEEFAPEFGFRSAALHAEAGAWPIEGELAGLRRDVDDVSDLEAAVRLGLGPHSAAAVAGLPAKQ